MANVFRMMSCPTAFPTKHRLHLRAGRYNGHLHSAKKSARRLLSNLAAV